MYAGWAMTYVQAGRSALDLQLVPRHTYSTARLWRTISTTTTTGQVVYSASKAVATTDRIECDPDPNVPYIGRPLPPYLPRWKIDLKLCECATLNASQFTTWHVDGSIYGPAELIATNSPQTVYDLGGRFAWDFYLRSDFNSLNLQVSRPL